MISITLLLSGSSHCIAFDNCLQLLIKEGAVGYDGKIFLKIWPLITWMIRFYYSFLVLKHQGARIRNYFDFYDGV